MISKSTLEKIRKCKAFAGMSVADVCMTSDFLHNLEKYMQAQKEEREAARNAIPKGSRLPAHTIDKIQTLGLMDSPTKFAKEFCNILNRGSKLNAAERRYICQLGQQAYNITIVNAVTKEFPETKSELLPKSN